MLTSVLCIYIVLVLLFKDFLHPVTILAALPLSLGGAFVGLLLAQKSFSMPSLIGLIMLMGIATKNLILLVEYAIVARRDHGMTRPAHHHDHAGHRCRHIADCDWPRRGRFKFSLADGGRRNRRADHLDGAESAGGAGGVYVYG